MKMEDFYVVRFESDWPNQADDDQDVEDEKHKTLYALFGLAIFRANCLEHSLVNLFAVSKLISLREQGERVMVDPFAQGFKDMMSKLIRRAQPHINLYPEVVHDLTMSLNRRNYLVHNFWRERVFDVYTEAGRTRLRTELEQDCAFLKQTDQRLSNKVLIPMMARVGITTDHIEAAFDREKRRLQESDDESPTR